MRNKKSQTFSIVVTLILGIVTILAFAVQITSLSTATTKLETTLFNFLEFILSLGFAWVLTRMVTQEEFQRSIKRFAISAYRRIVDIERAINGLKREVEIMRRRYPSDSYCELDIVHVVVVNTTQTLRSAIADWTDVIGEELDALQQIQALEEQKEEILVQEPMAEDDEQVQEIKTQISQLISTLPHPLRYQFGEITFDWDEAAGRLRALHRGQDGLRLEAFWDATFEHDPQDLQPGDKVQVFVDDVADRVGCLVAADERGRKLGVVTNVLASLGIRGASYANFVRAMQLCFGKSRYSGEIVSAGHNLRRERRYFRIRILDQAEWASESPSTTDV